MPPTFRIESLLSARQFVQPQLAGDRLYFISDLSGRLSLYVMDAQGSVPRPLIPPDIALPNPHHFHGNVVYRVLPDLGQILLMLDQDGDENYQPTFVPIDGGAPASIFGDRFAHMQVVCTHCEADQNIALFSVDPRRTPVHQTWRAHLATRELDDLGSSVYGNYPVAHSPDFAAMLLADGYTAGDGVLFYRRQGDSDRALLFGQPIEQRAADQVVPPNGIRDAALEAGGVLMVCALFDDQYGLAFFDLEDPDSVQPVTVDGLKHQGAGELVDLERHAAGRYTLTYNIDGASWVYEGDFDPQALRFVVRRVLVGEGALGNGVLESIDFDPASQSYALSFSTATSSSQIYVIPEQGGARRLTDERILGIPDHLLAPGEEASYSSHDGLRISARLFLPAAGLGFSAPHPLIFYVHGGPQSQERPDFTWFSMPLIQFFTLNGFAVWTPNVRGSSGYGMSYMKHVDRDWGGQDRLDHVAAFELLRRDPRLDMKRVGVMGRSYGGFMTLTLAGRHPELWRAACDMFGPYNLFRFIERLPETWKTYFHMAVGHPERDAEFLHERSPSTHLHQLACPLLVIQGANDPRVVERESGDVVEQLRAQGKQVDYVVYQDEGHDVLKFANKVDCYNRIVDFFRQQLMTA